MNNDFANYYYDYIGATGIHTISDYIDYTSNILNNRIDNIDIETSNIASNISSNITIDYYNKLDNKYKKLIEYKLESGTSNTYIYNSNVGGEIKFFIPVPYYDPIDNASGQPYRVKINALGKLYLYYNYNVAISLTDTEGWYDVINLVMGTRASVNTQGLAIGVIQGQIAGITLSINQNNAVVQTALQTISKDINDNIRPSIANATENLALTNLTRLDLSKTQFANTLTGNFESFLSRLGNNKYVSGGLGLTGAGGIIFSIAYGAIQNDHTAQVINNITDYQLNCNLNLSISDKNDLSNLASNLLISNVLKYNCNLCNLCLFNGFINSNIQTTQFIPSLKAEKIMLGNITTPNSAYQMEMTGDLNLNMLYLNSTSLTSLLNQKQGNLTFNNPLLNTTNIITLKKDASLTLDGSGNLKVADASASKWTTSGNNIYNNNVGNVGIGLITPTHKLDVNGNINGTEIYRAGVSLATTLGTKQDNITVSAPITKTINNLALSYDSSLTLSGNNLKVADASASKWTTSGTNIYNNNIGNVGIGLITPMHKLDVNGNIYGRNNLYIGNSTPIISSYTNATINSITGTDYKYLIYTANGTLVLNDLLNCDILVVGGGGGGGSFGGGGGAGQILYTTNFNLPNGTYNIVVGTGGTGATNQTTNGNNGNNSSITINGTTYTSIGGGGGGSRNDSGGYVGRAGNNGGSGGGGSHSDYSSTINVGGSSTKNTYSGWTSLGNIGGEGKDGNTGGYGSGGGGGAGSIGANAGTNSGGNGGTGVNLSSIFGTDVGHSGWFGGGGGGASYTGTSGQVGYGNGGSALLGGGGSAYGGNGLANTGGGGGGGNTGASGGTGGSGIVIIRFIETGKLGLGTTTPNNKLHVEKGSAFIGDNAYTSSGLGNANGYKLIFDNTYNGTAGSGNICNKLLLHNYTSFNAGFGIEANALVYQSGERHRFYTGTTQTYYGFLSFDVFKDQFNFYGNADGGSGGYIRNASAGGSAHTYLGLLNNNGSFGGFFLNSSARTADGGANNMTIRNDAGDLILSAKSSTPQIYLQESTDRIYMNGLVNIREGSGGGAYAVPTNYMQQGSLTIGSTNLNYGLGTAGWSTNTAGLMLECADNTEIAVHDAGQRLTSLIAYQGGTSYNTITIGRDMGSGWGTAWNVNIAGASLSLANEWYIVKGTTPTSVPNSLIFLHSTSTITSRWWLNGTQNGTSADISDERIKKEINDIDNALEKLLLIKPKEYYLCSDKDYNKKYGVIAQDINKEESLKHLIYTDKEYIANLLTNAKFIKEKIGEEEPILEYPEEKYIKSEENLTPYQRPKPKEIFKYTIITDKNLNGLINIDDELKIVLDNNDIDNIEIIIDDTPYNNRYKKRFVKVKKIIDDYSFEIYEDIEITDIEKENLFIYGKKVNDFLKLDYESLYCLNIKATQELIIKNLDLEKRLKRLEDLIIKN